MAVDLEAIERAQVYRWTSKDETRDLIAEVRVLRAENERLKEGDYVSALSWNNESLKIHRDMLAARVVELENAGDTLAAGWHRPDCEEARTDPCFCGWKKATDAWRALCRPDEGESGDGG
jgi:hypothetical protein